MSKCTVQVNVLGGLVLNILAFPMLHQISGQSSLVPRPEEGEIKGEDRSLCCCQLFPVYLGWLGFLNAGYHRQ